MLGIIGAMSEEVEFLKDRINNLKETRYNNIHFFEGNIDNKDVVLLQSGIGKVNASMSTTMMFEKYNIDYVINIGTAGGVISDAEVLDIVLSEKVAYHDVDVTAFNYEYGQVPNLPRFFNSDDKLLSSAEKILTLKQLPYHKGLIVSGDTFVSNDEQIKNIKKYFPDCIACEMEAAAIAHVCYLYKRPFIIIRSLSDIAGKKSHLSFAAYLKQAAFNSGNLVLKLINEL